jgi:hypothetical protein
MEIANFGFQHGDENIKAIYVDSEQVIRVGECEVSKIIVIMENGQMAGVPWLAVIQCGEMTLKYNAALIQGVDYL